VLWPPLRTEVQPRPLHDALPIWSGPAVEQVPVGQDVVLLVVDVEPEVEATAAVRGGVGPAGDATGARGEATTRAGSQVGTEELGHLSGGSRGCRGPPRAGRAPAPRRRPAAPPAAAAARPLRRTPAPVRAAARAGGRRAREPAVRRAG